MKSLVMLLALLLGSSGCALVFKGSKQEVHFASNPEKADVNNGGRYLGATPVNAEVERGGLQNIRVSKDGYAETYVRLERKADVPWFVWDVGTCAIPVLLCVPLLVDAVSGAWYSYDESYPVKLVALPRPAPVAPIQSAAVSAEP